MLEILSKWGLDILFALISAAVLGYAKWQVSKVKKELENAKKYAEEKEKQDVEDTIEDHLEPIYAELEELRGYVRETKNIGESHLKLIVASYRFRLV